MASIRGKDTAPELAVRKYLHRRGLRYRLHDRSLAGTPDIVFKSRGVIVFVHGCFWHGHKRCAKARLPKSRIEFWREKIERNMARDKKNIRRLRSRGWRVFVVWQCEICERKLDQLFSQITKDR